MPAAILPVRTGARFGSSISVRRQGLAWQILCRGQLWATCTAADVAHTIATLIAKHLEETP